MSLAGGVVRRSSAPLAEGISAQAVADALRAGVIVKGAHGACRLSDADGDPGLAGLAAACARMPRAVICLASAAHLAGLVNDPLDWAWLALPVPAHTAKPGALPQTVIRWSFDGAFDVGILEDEICGVRVRRTGPARTVVDLVRYARHFRGDDLGIRAGRRYFASGGSAEEVLSIAVRLKTPAAAMKTLGVLVRAAAGPVP